jgi:hypothetical protein
MTEFIPEQTEPEGRLTYALLSGLRSETIDEQIQWGVVAEVLCLQCTSIEVEFAKMAALGQWIEEMGIDPDSVPEFPHE